MYLVVFYVGKYVGKYVWVYVGVYTKSKSSELTPLRRKLLRQFPPPLRSKNSFCYCLPSSTILVNCPSERVLNITDSIQDGWLFITEDYNYEFEYEGIFNGDIEPQSINVTYAFFIGFLVVMSIIIVNLLVGLAVDDIKAVQDQAVLKRLAMQVELVLDVERLMPEPILRRFIKHYDTFKTSASTDLEFKTLLKLWSVNRIGIKTVEDTKAVVFYSNCDHIWSLI
jgi:hypothetical protein